MSFPVKARIATNAWIDLIIRHRNDFYIIILFRAFNKCVNQQVCIATLTRTALQNNNIAHENPPYMSQTSSSFTEFFNKSLNSSIPLTYALSLFVSMYTGLVSVKSFIGNTSSLLSLYKFNSCKCGRYMNKLKHAARFSGAIC